jgi:hypothetical protein
MKEALGHLATKEDVMKALLSWAYVLGGTAAVIWESGICVHHIEQHVNGMILTYPGMMFDFSLFWPMLGAMTVFSAIAAAFTSLRFVRIWFTVVALVAIIGYPMGYVFGEHGEFETFLFGIWVFLVGGLGGLSPAAILNERAKLRERASLG